ncbi:MAG: QueG-associated DUF1730 domain-containing protein [Planctomycetota bacterium]
MTVISLDAGFAAELQSAGFECLGITPAVDSGGFSNLLDWLDAGYAGSMDYLASRKDAYRHPRGVLPQARYLIALAKPYHASDHHPVGRGHGKIARYVWQGADYHDVIHRDLKPVCRRLNELHNPHRFRAVVDTAPLMEREVAELAGLGWRGKNTLLLNRTWGSYFFLAVILTDAEIRLDFPHCDPNDSEPGDSEPGDRELGNPTHSYCGTCTACLDACPTDAFVQANVLDARKCISYLTIEHDGWIDPGLREGMGDWLFGCDVCQQVCPWNRKRGRREQIETAGHRLTSLSPRELLQLDEAEFRERFRKTPLWRTRRRGMLRNAAIVLGNIGTRDDLPYLRQGLQDSEALVRGACAWAMARIDPIASPEILKLRLSMEADADVRHEIEQALRVCRRGSFAS